MEKQKAIQLLGGSVSAAATALGVSYEAIHKWPDLLPDRIAQRVMGAYAQDKLPELAAPQTTPSQGYDGPERRSADLEADGVDGMKLVGRRSTDKA